MIFLEMLLELLEWLWRGVLWLFRLIGRILSVLEVMELIVESIVDFFDWLRKKWRRWFGRSKEERKGKGESAY